MITGPGVSIGDYGIASTRQRCVLRIRNSSFHNQTIPSRRHILRNLMTGFESSRYPRVVMRHLDCSRFCSAKVTIYVRPISYDCEGALPA
jgi:hypothetical protein